MKNIFKIVSLLFVVTILFQLEEVDAWSSADYKNRGLCGNYEIAEFRGDGTIAQRECHGDLETARSRMRVMNENNLVVLGKVGSNTTIVDANVSLVDLSVGSSDVTYYYTDKNLKTAYTYMNNKPAYGGVDGVLLEAGFSYDIGAWVARVKVGAHVAWIGLQDCEIVPLSWVKSSSSYTVTNDSIKHNYVTKIQNTYNGSMGSVLGPKPTMLGVGTYYSYDGHYFYTDRATMIHDYKNGSSGNAINKDEAYYNYYLYLSNHTKTTYSSLNIDEYIRNNMGLTMDVYGDTVNSSQNNSRLYGQGTFFYNAQQKNGVNAILSLSLSRNETANGQSNLAINKNNGFGLNAVDSSPGQSANYYSRFSDSIYGYSSKWMTYGYLHPRDWRYFGPAFGDKQIGMAVKYSSDVYWNEKGAAHYYSFDKAKGLQDYNYYQLGVVTRQVNAYSDSNTSSKFIYSYPEAKDSVVIIGEKQGQSIEGNTTWYQVVSDLNIDSNGNEISSGDYNWNASVYIPAAYVKKINQGKNGYVSPNSVFEHADSKYHYDLYTEGNVFKPKVAITKKETNYYYDASLKSMKEQKVLKDKYVMVYGVSYDSNNKVVSYLVTSDYWYDQKEWVPADSIRIVKSKYAKITISSSNNAYTIVNSHPIDNNVYMIGAQYTYSYVPVLETIQNDKTWYKVPVKIDQNSFEYGYLMNGRSGVSIDIYESDGTGVVDGWYYEDGNTYYYEKGEAITGFRTIDGKLYFFSYLNGATKTGWQHLNGKDFYCNTDGTVAVGFNEIEDDLYYFDQEGTKKTGLIEVNGLKYYLNEQGIAQSGFHTISGKLYFFSYITYSSKIGWQHFEGKDFYCKTDGTVAIGLQYIDEEYYYFDQEGSRKTGLISIDNVKYFFQDNGTAYRGFKKVNNKLYFFSLITASSKTGWQAIEGQTFYCKTDGSVAIGLTQIEEQKYYFSDAGFMYKGFKKVEDTLYFFSMMNGASKTGWQAIDGNYFYCKSDGSVAVGLTEIEGVKYYFNDDGYMYKGFKKVGDTLYFFSMMNGASKTDWQAIDGNYFYCKPDGSVAVGLTEIEGVKYYFNDDGYMYKGFKKVGDTLYFFSMMNGASKTGWQGLNGKTFYCKTDGSVAVGEYVIDGKTYYFDENGYLI